MVKPEYDNATREPLIRIEQLGSDRVLKNFRFRIEQLMDRPKGGYAQRGFACISLCHNSFLSFVIATLR